MASIAKAKSISHGRALTDYAKRKAVQEGAHNLNGLDNKEVIQEMREVQQLHKGKISKPFVSGVLAPDLKSFRGRWHHGEPNWDDLQNIFMRKVCKRLKTAAGQPVKYDDLQYKWWQHPAMSKNKIPHLHFLINRVLPDGSVISDSFIGKIFKAVSEEMDRELGQKTAEELGKEQRKAMKEKANAALKEAARGQKKGSFSLDRFSQFCRQYGLFLTVSRSAGHDEPSGYYLQLDDSYDGEEHSRRKVSDIDRNLTLSRITKTFDKYVSLTDKEEKEKKLQEQQLKNKQIKQQQEDKKDDEQRPRRTFRL